MPDGEERTVRYDDGQVKLDWRIDWPARWWKLGVNVEPFGRDHASAGGSYDTGRVIMEDVFQALPPIPVPYDFINRAGDTKKMSASKGTGIYAADVVEVLPAELMRFFVLRYAPEKRLYFDQGVGVMRLFDEFAELLAKTDKTEAEQQLLYLCQKPVGERVVISRIPFSHVVASYQAALRDADKTLELLKRTEHAAIVEADQQVIREELTFIDRWLDHWAPDEVKFSLQDQIDHSQFNDDERAFLAALSKKVAAAPKDADGEWFHKAIYDLKEESNLPPKDLFAALYKALIGQSSGPRAGWFLSILPHDWLVKRLKLEA
jgi:lysyl-tRNA synthetase class 1